MAKNVIIGSGFLATALKNRLGDYTWYPTEDTEVIFYFSGVKHMDFEKNPEWHYTKEFNQFMVLLNYCKIHDIKLIYPSSALIYEKNIKFVDCKKSMEEVASGYKNTLGLRIFPVYGPNSQTFINEACRAIKDDIQPVIWGEGTQTRDFIYIDDFIDQVLESVDKVGILDIGTGIGKSFNEIVDTINKVLGKDIKPIYAPVPPDYSKGIKCEKPLKTNFNLEKGIRKICQSL